VLLAGLVALGLGLGSCRKDDAPAHLERAKAALFEQKADVALAEYKLALDLLERDTSAQAVVYRARALRGAADTYYLQLRDFKRAVDVYKELITLCPEAPETLEGRLHLASLLRHEFRDLRGAIAELTAALARNPPQSAELSYQVAAMYFELQDYEQCALEAGTIAKKFMTSAYVDDALYLRAQALGMMDDRKWDAQRAFLDVVDRFDPGGGVGIGEVGHGGGQRSCGLVVGRVVLVGAVGGGVVVDLGHGRVLRSGAPP